MNDQKQSKKLISKVIPWIVGGSVLLYLIWRIEPQPLINALLHARLSIYIPALVIFVYLSFLVDSQNLQALMHSFDHMLTWSESKLIRGASYLIMVVDYTLGMGSVVYFLKSKHKVPMVRGTAIMIYYNYINQFALLVLGLIGYLIIDFRMPWLNKGIEICLVMTCLSLLLIGLLKHSDQKIIAKIKNTGLLQSFIDSSVRVYILNVLYRVGYYFCYVLFFLAAVKAFDIQIPFTVLVAYVPIILLVISIPVSPFGLGTSQATMLYLFKDYGSQPQILAFSLVYSVSVLLLRALLGLYYYWIIIGKINLEGRSHEGFEPKRKTSGESA